MASIYAVGRMRTEAIKQLKEAANNIAAELDLDPLNLPTGTRGGVEYNQALQLQAVADHLARINEALSGGVKIGDNDLIDYESKTVPQLKELAENRGIELESDDRKADIIAKLEGGA